jgi:hypothetical protein
MVLGTVERKNKVFFHWVTLVVESLVTSKIGVNLQLRFSGEAFFWANRLLTSKIPSPFFYCV